MAWFVFVWIHFLRCCTNWCEMSAEQINEPCQLWSGVKPPQQAAALLLLSRLEEAVKNSNCNLSAPLLIKSVSSCCSTVCAKFLVLHIWDCFSWWFILSSCGVSRRETGKNCFHAVKNYRMAMCLRRHCKEPWTIPDCCAASPISPPRRSNLFIRMLFKEVLTVLTSFYVLCFWRVIQGSLEK